MKKELHSALNTHCRLHWWNYGSKTLGFSGRLGDLLKKQNISFSVRKTDTEGQFIFTFKCSNDITNTNCITYRQVASLQSFPFFAKLAIQMELVRMGDKSQLYVEGTFRPSVTVNK